MSEHDKYRENIEAYVLGSLDTAELLELEIHLRTNCPECAQAVTEARVVVARLAHLAPDAVPSDILRGRLLQQVRAEAPADKSESTKTRIPVWMWGAVAAALLFAFYNAWDARRLTNHIEVMHRSASEAEARQQELQYQLAVAEREALILTDPNSMKFVLAATQKNMPQLEVMWHDKMGICVSGRGVPMPPANRVLQLWLIPRDRGGKPMPSVMTRPDANGHFMLMVSGPTESVRNIKALAITEEPAAGSIEPTSAPMWLGSVS